MESSDEVPPRTVYLAVAVPEQLTIWVKTPDCPDWLTVDLNRFFDRR